MIFFGDIYLVEIPASVTEGREQQGLRPAIIVQTSDNIDKIPTILIIPFTTQIKASNNNLSSVSVALIFQLRAIDKKRLKNKIGKLNSKDTEVLKQTIKTLLNI